MKGFGLGTALVTMGALLFLVLTLLGASRLFAMGIGITVSTIGFTMQIASAFKVRRRFNEEIMRTQREGAARLERIRALPPEEALHALLPDT